MFSTGSSPGSITQGEQPHAHFEGPVNPRYRMVGGRGAPGGTTQTQENMSPLMSSASVRIFSSPQAVSNRKDESQCVLLFFLFVFTYLNNK